jgi:hypothetical protein
MAAATNAVVRQVANSGGVEQHALFKVSVRYNDFHKVLITPEEWSILNYYFMLLKGLVEERKNQEKY